MKILFIFTLVFLTYPCVWANEVSHKILRFPFKINAEVDKKDSKMVHQFRLEENYSGNMKIIVWWKNHRERLEFSFGMVSPALGLIENKYSKVNMSLGFPYVDNYEITKPYSIEPSSWKAIKDWFVSIADFEFKKFAEGEIFIVYPSAAPYREDDFRYLKEIAELFDCNLDYEYNDNSNILIEVSGVDNRDLRSDKIRKIKFERTAFKDEIIFNNIYAAIMGLKPMRTGASVSAIAVPPDIIRHKLVSRKEKETSQEKTLTPNLTSEKPTIKITDSRNKSKDDEKAIIDHGDTNSTPNSKIGKETQREAPLAAIVTPESQYEKSFYDHMNETLIHRKRVFEWQLFSSKLIFFTVLLLVIIGIYFSWLQFCTGIGKGKEKQSESEPRTELEISASGFKVKSPILGVIILLISLAFFYLYLAHVYPIDVVPLDREVVEANSALNVNDK